MESSEVRGRAHFAHGSAKPRQHGGVRLKRALQGQYPSLECHGAGL
jgi:hypothetical protein